MGGCFWGAKGVHTGLRALLGRGQAVGAGFASHRLHIALPSTFRPASTTKASSRKRSLTMHAILHARHARRSHTKWLSLMFAALWERCICRNRPVPSAFSSRLRVGPMGRAVCVPFHFQWSVADRSLAWQRLRNKSRDLLWGPRLFSFSFV